MSTAVPTPAAAPTTAAATATSVPVVAATLASAPTTTALPVTYSTAVTTGPRITSATIARDEQNGDPVEPTTQFHVGATDFLVVGTLAGATQDTTVNVKWVPINAPQYSGATPIDSDSFDVKGSEKFWLRLNKDDSLPPGRYAAQVSVGSASPQTLPFDVLPADPPVLARPSTNLPDTPAPTLAASKPINLEFILDASGSMDEPAGDVSKMEAAHTALHAIVDKLSTASGLNVGLRAFAHRSQHASQPQACQDTQLLAPVQGVNKDQLNAQIDAIQAVGAYTPLTYAVQQAAQDFPAGGQNIVVLVTDGKENCQADPVGSIKSTAAQAGLIVDTIRFDVQADADAEAQLQAIAAATGGVYFDATSPDDLVNALNQLTTQQVNVVQTGNVPGQLTLGMIPGATLAELTISDSHGQKAVDDYNVTKTAYPLPAGTYTVMLKPGGYSPGALSRVEIGSGQESVLQLGAMALTSRGQPSEVVIFDEDASRRMAEMYELPNQPFMLPSGRYAIWVKQSGASDFETVQRNIRIQPTIVAQVTI